MKSLKALRLCLRYALLSAIPLSALILTSSPALAVTCNPGFTQDATTASVSCDVGVLVNVNSGGVTLANDAAVTITNAPIVLGTTARTVMFKFASFVKDHRGSTDGWSLQASTATEMVNSNNQSYPIALTANDATSSCTNGLCPPTMFTALNPLTATAQTFQQAGNAVHNMVVDGEYNIVTDGQFILPVNAPSGTYSGIISITFTNSF